MVRNNDSDTSVSPGPAERLTVAVLDTNAVGAFCWPSGAVFVTRGLVDLADDDELCAAIAHEAGHLVADDHLPRAVALDGWRRPSATDAEIAADLTARELLKRSAVSEQALPRLLGKLAAHWRARFDVPLTVVVGSNGKTTVKEMTAAILRAHFGGDAVLATEGNLNNAIGLPLTLLRLSDRTRAAVVELGMNHRGETREQHHVESKCVDSIRLLRCTHNLAQSPPQARQARKVRAMLELPYSPRGARQ